MERVLNKEEDIELNTQLLNQLFDHYLKKELNINYCKLLYKTGREHELLDAISYSHLMLLELKLSQGTLQNCLNYYEECKEKGLQPVSEMYSTLIKFFLKTKKFEKLNFIQSEVETYDINVDIDIINGLLDCYLNYDQPIEKFNGLFNYLEAKRIKPDIKTFEFITDAYVKFKQNHFGYTLVDKMVAKYKLEPTIEIITKLNLNPEEILKLLKKHSLSPSIDYFNDLINQKIKFNSFKEAFDWAQHLVKYNHEPNTITYTLLLDALVKGDRIEKALELFEEMKALELPLDQRVFLILIEGYNRKGEFKSAMELLDKMINEFNIPPNQYIFNNLLGYCSKQKDLENAKKIRSLINEYNCALDTRGYNCLLTLYLDTDNFSQCWKLYKNLKSERVKADQVTYSLLLDTANREMNTAKMMKVYEDMIENQIYPAPTQFEIILKQLFSQSEADRFLEVWSKFISLKLVPTQSIIHVILNFCSSYQKIEIIKLSFQYVKTMMTSTGNTFSYEKGTWTLLMDQLLNFNDYRGFEEVYYFVCDKLNFELDKEILEEWLLVLPQDCNIYFRLRYDLKGRGIGDIFNDIDNKNKSNI